MRLHTYDRSNAGGRTNLKIKTIKNVSKNCHISLSTDDKKNINLILGRYGTGDKTTLFNKIKSCLARTEDRGGIELELSGEDNYRIAGIFVGEKNELSPEYILDRLNRAGLAEDALADIHRRANLMLRNIHGVFDDERNMLHMENCKIIMPSNLAGGPKVILYFAILIAVREHKGVELPLIVDDHCLGSMNPVFGKRLVQMFIDNTTQTLLFTSWFLVMNSVPAKWEYPAGITSLYDDMKNDGTLGSLYVLSRHGVVKIVDPELSTYPDLDTIWGSLP